MHFGDWTFVPPFTVQLASTPRDNSSALPMDSYSGRGESSREQTARVPLPRLTLQNSVVLDQTSRERLRFPAEDGGHSLADMARQDLQLALQLLAERAQYITGASGAAIALREGDQMVCAASAGPCAPEQGSELQINTGLTAESVRTRQVLRCDNAETDPRVNRESCRALGIVSLMVVPLLRNQDAIGVFELLANRACAFEERDVIALQRISEMILTAVEHAEAAERAMLELAAPELAGDAEPASEVANPVCLGAPTQTHAAEPVMPAPAPSSPNVKTCAACGFPVSGGRTLCLDCESGSKLPPEVPAFLSQFEDREPGKSWLRKHAYTIGTLLVAAGTLSFLVLYLR